MNTVPSSLQLLSAASIGIYAGAMLTEGFVLVPYWRSASAPEFFSWYAANTTRLQGFFGPVTWAAGLFAIATAVATIRAGRARAMDRAGGRSADGRSRIQLLHLFRAREHKLLRSRRER